MDIKITQIHPKVGIQTTNAKLELSNNGETDYIVTHTEPKIAMHTTQAKVFIDQTRCFADEELKNLKDFMAEIVSKAKSQAYQYIAKKSQEGDSYAAIESRGNRIVSAIKQDMYSAIDYNVGLMPTQGPEIFAQMGDVQLEFEGGEVNASYNNVPIEGTYTPGNVSFYLLQKGSVNIEYVGNYLDAKV